MKKKILKRVLFSVIIIILIYIIGYTVTWLVGLNLYTKPFLENHKNEFVKTEKDIFGLDDTWGTNYELKIEKETYNIKYGVSHLNYTLLTIGNSITIMTDSKKEKDDDGVYKPLNDYDFILYIHPHLFKDYGYSLQILTLKDDYEKMKVSEEEYLFFSPMDYIIDENLNTVGNSNYTEEELRIFEEAKPKLREFWENDVVPFFGADNVYK